jgi:serine/threonine protein kinase
MKNLDMQKSVQATGTRLNKYILTEEIGRGGYGIVYRAYHEDNISEPVAVKIIEDSGNLDSLLIEPELLSRLNHPNIISLKDFFIYAGKLVLVTEYIDGVDLQSYLSRRGKLTVEEVIVFLTQMANALAHAHGNNIIHRDIKLSNILFTGEPENPRFVLVDFGISRMAEGIQTIKRLGGTYYYMAPEQLRGRPCEQSDLWSLGVCAYTLLTGIKPFEGNTEKEISKKIQLSIPQAPSEISGEIDPNLETILFHLLEKQLIHRTTSAIELLEEMKIFSELEICKSNLKSRKVKQVLSSTFTSEEEKSRELKGYWIRFWIFTFLSTIPSGIIGDSVSIAGMIIFYTGQEKRNLSRTITGISLLIIGSLISVFTSVFIISISKISNPNISSLQFIGILSSLFILFGVHYLTKVKLLQEDLILYKTLREASKNRATIINLLKNFVDRNWGNINLYQKYIELLLLDGQIETAIVESKILIQIDPYDFGANLLLANGYLEVGLYEECVQVCNNYLALSGYSFEFSDIKDRCLMTTEEIL